MVLSGWSSKVTCPLCATRVIVHKKVETWEEVTLLIDLEDPTVAKFFHFESKRFKFAWLIGLSTIYVYNEREAYSPSFAIPIPYEDEKTYENAQVTAKMWILEHGDRHAPSGPARKSTPKKPVAGPHCDKCGKKDEGDCVESPADSTLLRCMPCYIKGARA